MPDNKTVQLKKQRRPFNTSPLPQYYNKVQKISAFSDIAVKLQEHVYHLNKVILASKSAFFEKLFTADFDDRKHDEVEIHSIDEETFLSIIEHIYGADLAIHERNFATLFIAMDYLQMEIDVQNFIDFIVEKNELLVESEMFKLYHYVSMLSDFESVTACIHQHFSQNWDRICGLQEFLSLTPTMLIELLNWHSRNYYFSKTTRIIETCCEWICHDFQNRLPCIVDLVNAVKLRFGLTFTISNENYKPFEEPDKQRRRERVKMYFHKLLNYNAKTRFEPAINESKKRSAQNESKPTYKVEKSNNILEIREPSDDAKWKTYLEDGQFCDISVQAGDEIFKLHRIKLHMEIPYFRNLLSQSPNINHHTLDAAIDGATFKEIVKSIYCCKEIDLVDESQIHRLLCCSEILQMKKISKKIHKHVIENWKTMKDNVIDVFPSVLRDGEEEDRDELINLIEVGWEEICEGTRLTKMSFDALESIVSLPGLRLENEHSLLNICCKWIHHDVENRYHLIPELALAINRNSMVDFQEHSSLVPEDLCSEQQIDTQLQSTLSKTQLVSTSAEPLASYSSEELTPCFMVSKKTEISILNAKFDEIISIPFSKNHLEVEHLQLAAALINDNLFMIFYVNYYEYSFQVYNWRSKKITSLTFDYNLGLENFRLLNCNNELYFSTNNRINNEKILKYSYKLNRWIKFPLQKFGNTEELVHASDGKTLYRFSESLNLRQLDEIESYNFEKQSWAKLDLHLVNVEEVANDFDYEFQGVTVVDGNLCFLFGAEVSSTLYASCVIAYQEEIRTWHVIAQKSGEWEQTRFQAFKQVKDSIVFTTNSQVIYSYSITNRKWQMEKEIQVESQELIDKVIPIHFVL